VSTFKQINRTVHTSASGIEIVRQFYLKPYSQHPSLLEALQGTVRSEAGPADPDVPDLPGPLVWKRQPPAQDHWIETCYCTETRVVFPDPDVFSTADPLDKEGQGFENELKLGEEFPAGVAGCHVFAHYRPLISALPDGDEDNGFERWDFVDPTFTPGFRQIPWPDGLYVKAPEAIPLPMGGIPLALVSVVGGLFAAANTEQTIAIPDAAGIPYQVPINDISIRRILVGEPPWKAIAACANGVNKSVWPVAGTPLAKGLPSFPPRTLKFVNAETPSRLDSKGEWIYDVILHFEQISEWTEKLYDNKAHANPGWVTWNHVFVRPGRLGINRPTAWYEVFRGSRLEINKNVTVPFDIPGLAMDAGQLHDAVDFDILFKLKQTK